MPSTGIFRPCRHAKTQSEDERNHNSVIANTNYHFSAETYCQSEK